MTLRYADGYDYFPTGQSGPTRDRLWGAAGYYWHYANDSNNTTNVSPDFFTGRFGFGNCTGWNAWFTPGGGNNFYQVIRPTGIIAAEGYFGQGFYIGGDNYLNSTIVIFDAVNNQPQLSIQFAANGTLKLWRGYVNGSGGSYTGTLIATSLPGTFQSDQWAFIEVHYLIGASGSCEIKINTKVIFTLSSINTQYTALSSSDSIGFIMSGGIPNTSLASTFLLDDLYFNDTAGSVNNSYLGNVRVFTQATNGAGSVTDFSRFGSQPTNWQTAQNKLLDDTQYVYDGTAGQYDLYQMQANVTGPSVHGVQTRIGARMDDATQVTLRSVINSAGTQVEGADHLINQTYTYYTDIFELDPHTGIGWTGTNANLLTAGPKKQV